MKRSETWDDGPVQTGPEGEAMKQSTARELLRVGYAEEQAPGGMRDVRLLILADRVEKVLALKSEPVMGSIADQSWALGYRAALKGVRRILNGEVTP